MQPRHYVTWYLSEVLLLTSIQQCLLLFVLELVASEKLFGQIMVLYGLELKFELHRPDGANLAIETNYAQGLEEAII